MQKSFNSDIQLLGNDFHVQTEDWGLDNPFLVSRIFKGGAVLKSIKTSYSEIIPGSPTDQAICLAMHAQHHRILDLMRSGQLTLG